MNKTNKNSHDSSFSYHGQVNVNTLYRGKPVASRSKHNEGLLKLFAGLCSQLAGLANTDDVVPTYIQLYTLNLEDAIEANQYVMSDWSTLRNATFQVDGKIQKVISPITSFLPITSAVVQNIDSKPTVSFQIKIPYDLITSGQVYLMALYPKNINTEADDALAVHKLTNEAGWDPLQILPGHYDYSMLVEWQMDFANK